MIEKLLQMRMSVYNNPTFQKELASFVEELGEAIAKSRKERKIFICGNGGSASQASHFAAELTVRYKKKRNSYFALSLSTDTSVITAAANDYSYEDLFSMQLENMASKGDILIALSTSGNSQNVNKALEKARELELDTFALLGKTGGGALAMAKRSLVVPTMDTATIQELHLTVIHLICEYLENVE